MCHKKNKMLWGAEKEGRIISRFSDFGPWGWGRAVGESFWKRWQVN